MRSLAATALVLLLMATGAATAQTFDYVVPPPEPPRPEEKSIPVALTLAIAPSVSLSVAGFAMRPYEKTHTVGTLSLGLGWVLTPSLGHYYAGEWGRGLAFSGGRLLLVGVWWASQAAAAMESFQDLLLGLAGGEPEHDSRSYLTIGAVAFWASAGLTLWEWWITPGAVRRHNESIDGHSFYITPTPMVIPGTHGAEAGFGLTGGFVF